METGRALGIKSEMMGLLYKIEKLSKDLQAGGWKAQIGLIRDDKKVAYINLGDLTDEDFLGVNLKQVL